MHVFTEDWVTRQGQRPRWPVPESFRKMVLSCHVVCPKTVQRCTQCLLTVTSPVAGYRSLSLALMWWRYSNRWSPCERWTYYQDDHSRFTSQTVQRGRSYSRKLWSQSTRPRLRIILCTFDRKKKSSGNRRKLALVRESRVIIQNRAGKCDGSHWEGKSEKQDK